MNILTLEYIIPINPMISGRDEPRDKLFHIKRMPNGRVWLWADVANAAEYVYTWTPSCDRESGSFQGFGGATLTFNTVDGEELKLKGPWHGNSNALYEDTGIDIRNKYRGRVIHGQALTDSHKKLIKPFYMEPEEGIIAEYPSKRSKRYAGYAFKEHPELEQIAYYTCTRGGSSSGYHYRTDFE